MFRFILAAAIMIAAVSTMSLAKSETYEIDVVHSAILFEAGHLGVSRAFGRFNDFSGTIVMDKADPAASSINITLNPASVDTNSADRDEHLRGPDFFNTVQYPTWTFNSTSVSAGKNGAYRVKGDLTAHGKTQPVSFDIIQVGEGEDPWGGYRSGWLARFTIKRSDFGMEYMLDGLGDEVNLTISLEGIRS